MYRYIFFLVFFSFFSLTSCQRLAIGTQAPPFKATSLDKEAFDLSALRGKKVLLSFMRNVGCPVCNLHTHELLAYADSLKALGVEILMIHQSPIETIKKYLAQDEREWSFQFISDTEQRLYKLYKVKPSFLRWVSSAWRGALAKRKKGEKLYKTKIPQEGKRGMLGADFLLDEQGKLIAVNYCRFVGDHLPPANIYKQFKENK